MRQDLAKILAELKKNHKEVDKEFRDAVSINALEGRNEAVKKAPAAFGKLRQQIGIESINNYEKKVVSNADYSAYVEFGTGGKVDFPPEWEDIARQAKAKKGSTGSFDDGVEAVAEWCRLKGIDQKNAPSILFFLMKDGQEPRPFMFPAWQKVKEQFKKDLNGIINKPR
jgi:HK97 gp10 family phage protein